MAVFAPVVALLAACGAPPAPELAEAPQKRAPRPSLVLVTLDTTRADRIGAYGYPGALTPTIDALAATGVRFARAYSAVPLTTPAHATILTGLYPTRHGIHSNGDAVLGEDVQTLAETLSAHGYHTAASVAAFVTTRVWNLDQGFDAYFDEVRGDARNPNNRWMRERPAGEVVDDALAWLEQVPPGEPFFLWVHFYDAHRPYRPPAEWLEAAGGRRYDGEIAYVDSQLARLAEAVDARGGDDVAWIVVGDHGEALAGEHGETDHGMFLFDPTMHVPFIVRPPGGVEGGRVVRRKAVSIADVTPTALGLLGIDVPEGLDGRDLAGLVRGEDQELGPVYMEAYSVQQRFGFHPEVGAAEGTWKLMDTPDARLYDIASDPGERSNVIGEHADVAERLRAFVRRVEAAAASTAGGGVAPEMTEQLAALGYVATGTAAAVGERKGEDAKLHLDDIRRIERARALASDPTRADDALAAYREILRDMPDLVEARLGLANLYAQLGRLPEQERVLREALEREPDSAVLRQNLAMCLFRQGRLDEARAEAERVLALVPEDAGARGLVLRSLGAQGRVDEALARAREWEAAGELAPAVQAEVGLLLMVRGDLAAAEPRLLASLADDVPRLRVHFALARIAAAREDIDAAMEHLRVELEHFPFERDARWTLANMFMRRERWDEAAAEYAFLVEQQPEDVEARRAWAQAVFNAGDYPRAQEILAPALDAAPDDADVLLLQANILAKLGRREEGRALYEQAQAIHADELRRKAAARPVP